jgi:hypothetical protein
MRCLSKVCGVARADDEAKGRRDLVEACPYGHVWWNEEHSQPEPDPFSGPERRQS